MNRVDETKALVEEILADIEGDEHRDRRVPHGFTVGSVMAETVPSYFPEGAEHVEVKLRMEVPVIFSVQNGRAALPVTRDNLNSLRAWIEKELWDRVTRLEVSGWDISPTRDPDLDGKGHDLDPVWTVNAVIRER